MSAEAVPRVSTVGARSGEEPRRIAFLGPQVWLDGCCPPGVTERLTSTRVEFDARFDATRALVAVRDFEPQVTVVFDPVGMPPELLGALPGVTLGVLVGGVPSNRSAQAIGHLDRVVSFRPALTGKELAVGGGAGPRVWRAIPPPVSDAMFGEVRRLEDGPRAITVGRYTRYREAMLSFAKHEHDLLQVVHGVTGGALVELLRECDVGVYVAPAQGGGFGHQVGMHLAAGHLLLSERLMPAHGLERNIDYLQFYSREELAWTLLRMRRFPDMHHRIRVRGRLKAEQFRASRVFSRITHDLLADVAAFGSESGVSPRSTSRRRPLWR